MLLNLKFGCVIIKLTMVNNRLFLESVSLVNNVVKKSDTLETSLVVFFLAVINA